MCGSNINEESDTGVSEQKMKIKLAQIPTHARHGAPAEFSKYSIGFKPNVESKM